MATLAQQPVHTFSPIKSPIDDSTGLINNCVTISKIKTKNSPSSTTNTNTTPHSNASSPALSTSPKMNGNVSPKPHTTSQVKFI